MQRNKSSLISIDGSSTVYPISEKIIQEFSVEQDGLTFSHTISGTSGGFNKLCAGIIEIANASRKITKQEARSCTDNSIEFMEIEVGKDGIALVVNSENYWVDFFTVQELQKLWSLKNEKEIKTWKDIRSSWPDEPIQLFGPSSASGTYDYFSEVILDYGSSRGDYVASENDILLVDGVADNKYGLGFFGFAYYKENYFSLKLIPIDDQNPENGDGPITPTENSVKNGTYQPLSRTLYMYVSTNALANEKLQDFIEFYLIHASNIVSDVGNIPHSENIYQKYLSQLDSIKTNLSNN
ncbi:PstS family phosphate ABC transporter substrate-binding protein [Gracilimonas sp.]|uniref:PstS family phosphate ABC transporter substrate-binding protein n=1 Tax=Gracilimonas sp. TaxID=1974203 RepID=UPI0032F08DF8